MHTYSILFRARRVDGKVIDLWNKQVKAYTVESAMLRIYEEFEEIELISLHNVSLVGEQP